MDMVYNIFASVMVVIVSVGAAWGILMALKNLFTKEETKTGKK